MIIKSPLLQRLDKGIAAAASPLRSAPLKAQRAILLARHGDLAGARGDLTALHQQAFQHPHAEVSAWLQLAEGLMSYYSDLSDGAPDKIRRAKSLAKSAGLTEVEGLASAWLAMFAYVNQDIEGVVRHARECLELSSRNDHAARGRLAIALALTHDDAELAQSARGWYAEARKHASSEGDDASLSALMFNMAAMRTNRARHHVLSQSTSGSVTELMMAAESFKHYDQAVGVSSKAELTPLLRAQVLSLNGEFAAAAAIYEQHLPQAMSLGMTRLTCDYLADLAWCRVHTGQLEQALQQARRAEQELDPSCHLNDRASTHSRLAQVHAALGDTESAQRHAAQAATHWQAVAEQHRHWAAALAEAGLSQPPST